MAVIGTTAFAVRNTIMSSTKISPAEIVLGAKLQEPIDKFLPATVCMWKQIGSPGMQGTPQNGNFVPKYFTKFV